MFRAGDDSAADELLALRPGLGAAERADLLPLLARVRRLHGLDSDAARVVGLRLFCGLSLEEAADVVGESKRTVERRWMLGRTFLQADDDSSD